MFPYSQHSPAQEPLEKDSGNQIVTEVDKKYQIKFLLPWVKVTRTTNIRQTKSFFQISSPNDGQSFLNIDGYPPPRPLFRSLRKIE